MLFCEHSPIRLLRFKWRWNGIKSWISVHFVRHWLGIVHWVSTRRTDRTGVNRDDLKQSELVNHEAEANAQALINISRRRLCRQAAEETQEAWRMVKQRIHNEGQTEMAAQMVRECVYRNGLCPEMNCCGYNQTEAFKKELEEYRGIIINQVSKYSGVE